MAEVSRFFDGTAYNSADMAEMFYYVQNKLSGVKPNVDNELGMDTPTGLTYDLKTGVAFKNGYFYRNSSTKSLTSSAVTTGNKRIDRIILRLDNVTNLNILARVVEGVETAGTPSAPSVVSSTDILLWQLLIDNTTGTPVFTLTDERETIVPSVYESTSTSPFSYNLLTKNHLLVTTGASAFTVNLLPAASVIGKQYTISKIDSGAGSIAITPNGTDVISNAGNVAVYLGSRYQSITILAIASGQWEVVAGVFAPDQSVDTDGSQYELGKLHHMPLSNTTDRSISVSPPSVGNYSSAYTATGVVGVPSGAKAIRAKIKGQLTSTAGGNTSAIIAFTDNNSNVPTGLTSHPVWGSQFSVSAGGQIWWNYVELDIPLNVSGQFYLFTNTLTNATAAMTLAVVGYYMGD